jgi:hypothetical protein
VVTDEVPLGKGGRMKKKVFAWMNLWESQMSNLSNLLDEHHILRRAFVALLISKNPGLSPGNAMKHLQAWLVDEQ